MLGLVDVSFVDFLGSASYRRFVSGGGVQVTVCGCMVVTSSQSLV